MSKRSSLATIFLVVFIDMLGFGIAIPLFAPLFLNADGILPASYPLAMRTLLLGLMIAAYPVMQFFGAPMLGALSDRIGRKKVFLISLAGTCAGYILTGLGVFLGNIWLLFLSRALDGFTGGNISVALSSIADISEGKAKARNFGLIGMAFGLGFIHGPYAGGKLADPGVFSWFTFATPFWFAAILTLVNIVFVVFAFKETLRTPIAAPISVLTGFRNLSKAFALPNLRAMFLVSFLLIFGFNFFTQFFQVFLIEKFNYGQSQIGNLFAYIGLWIALAQGLIARPVASRVVPEKVLSFSLFCLALVFPLLLIPDKPAYLFAILPFLAIFQGLTQPNTAAIISNSGNEQSQGEILGINQSVQAAAMAVPPIIAGLISSINVGLPIAVAGLCTLLSWIVFMFIYRRQKRVMFEEAA